MTDKYIPNPKTEGSGIVGCIPQDSRPGGCPVACVECFFNNGGSYLEPLEDNLPNIPTVKYVGNRIVRVNDGLDSLVDLMDVADRTKQFNNKFYNTSLYNVLDYEILPGPVVVTINPKRYTNSAFYKFIIKEVQNKIMMVRFRANAWNWKLCSEAIDYYTNINIPFVITMMRYTDIKNIPKQYLDCYIEKKSVLNTYYCPDYSLYEFYDGLSNNPLVSFCGSYWSSYCKDCGTCLKNYFRIMEKYKGFV